MSGVKSGTWHLMVDGQSKTSLVRKGTEKERPECLEETEHGILAAEGGEWAKEKVSWYRMTTGAVTWVRGTGNLY